MSNQIKVTNEITMKITRNDNIPQNFDSENANSKI